MKRLVKLPVFGAIWFVLAGQVVDQPPCLRSEYAEPPRLGEVVVRCVPGQVEQLAERRLVDGLGSVLFVRPPGTDGVHDVHGPGR